jgi:CDGSH-type Zn-finger protein
VVRLRQEKQQAILRPLTHGQPILAAVEFKAEESGTIPFCGCKNSGNKPRCDGTHRSL